VSQSQVLYANKIVMSDKEIQVMRIFKF